MKFAGGRDELGTDLIGFEEDAFLACVEEAEGWMRVVAKHGATTIVGGGRMGNSDSAEEDEGMDGTWVRTDMGSPCKGEDPPDSGGGYPRASPHLRLNFKLRRF